MLKLSGESMGKTDEQKYNDHLKKRDYYVNRSRELQFKYNKTQRSNPKLALKLLAQFHLANAKAQVFKAKADVITAKHSYQR